jgi:hypothetical protein
VPMNAGTLSHISHDLVKNSLSTTIWLTSTLPRLDA